MERNEGSEPMVVYPLRVRVDQKDDLDYLETLGYKPAQLIRIGIDREIEKAKAKEELYKKAS
ncbi:hypothetical protein FVR03_01305 [Pontibacter qinzhouensis]|uniref:Uncharacterized protein n=1 Tax=Pontibacter qinzhouensis TaxID=2603253 RepID=A0A5C8KDT7_9BACT|nr:hypothetical protein [Pontibacter qinzhouensis]TXK52381.1 hypothetical protein FVR03_01305 [Pontibacter qinzhouensis]